MCSAIVEDSLPRSSSLEFFVLAVYYSVVTDLSRLDVIAFSLPRDGAQAVSEFVDSLPTSHPQARAGQFIMHHVPKYEGSNKFLSFA